MFQLVPVFLGLFDSTVQKLMNGFRDIFYELAYSNLSNMLSDLNEKVGTISTELSTAPDAWQGGTIWSLIVKIAEQVALPVAGTVFTFVILWELISMLIQPNNLADVDFVSVLMKWLIKSVVAAWFISNSLTICNCFFGVGASMVSKTTTVLNQQVTDNTQDSVLLKYLSDNYGDQDEDAESGDVSGLISLTVSTWFIDIIIKVMGSFRDRSPYWCHMDKAGICRPVHAGNIQDTGVSDKELWTRWCNCRCAVFGCDRCVERKG